MRKHLFGFGLFISIIGFFASVFYILGLWAIPEIDPVGEEMSRVNNVRYCDFRSRKSELTQLYATADRRRGQITVYVTQLPRKVSISHATSEMHASFSFYTVNGEEVKFVDVIEDRLMRSKSANGSSEWILQFEADWVDIFGKHDNLYVVPRISYSGEGRGGVSAFSRETARPVVIRN